MVSDELMIPLCDSDSFTDLLNGLAGPPEGEPVLAAAGQEPRLPTIADGRESQPHFAGVRPECRSPRVKSSSLATGVLPDPRSDAGPPPSLESQRMGLLTTPSSSAARGTNLERWIASNLDLELDGALTQAPRNIWNRIIQGLPGIKRAPKKPAGERAMEARGDGWPRFHVGYKRGITLVRLCDRSLLKESMVQEFACDLIDLIEAGNHRIVLSFSGVERVTSLVVVAVQEAAARARSGDGGALKVCGLASDLATIFAMAGSGAPIQFHPDEARAIESPWPQASGPRALPVEVLTCLLTAADPPPARGGVSFEVPMTRIEKAARTDERRTDRPDQTKPADLWLQINTGAAKGRRIAVNGARFVIGRDRSCNLRLGSPLVSKLHAAILRRDGRVFLRDLGSTNGTLVSGRPVRNREIEVRAGDRIQIGPIVATLATGPEAPETERDEDRVIGWLRQEGDDNGGAQLGCDDTLTIPTRNEGTGPSESDFEIKCEVIQNVLVVTPQSSALDDPEIVENLRVQLRALYDAPAPRQVVVNLEYIGHLSAQAIGVLLAHHLRLDQIGGAMRICQARARVMAVLHQVRLTMLVECYPTLDEAVLGAWPGPAKKQSETTDS
jgi:anti-anti-sigma factor